MEVKFEANPEYNVGVKTEFTDSERRAINKALKILQSKTFGRKITNPESAVELFMVSEPQDGREHFRVLWLNNQNQVIALETVSTGTNNATSVYPREMVKRALVVGAAACIITHNHPSGTTEPSNADIQITKRLKEAFDLVDIRLLDHVITANGRWKSLAEMGY